MNSAEPNRYGNLANDRASSRLSRATTRRLVSRSAAITATRREAVAGDGRRRRQQLRMLRYLEPAGSRHRCQAGRTVLAAYNRFGGGYKARGPHPERLPCHPQAPLTVNRQEYLDVYVDGTPTATLGPQGTTRPNPNFGQYTGYQHGGSWRPSFSSSDASALFSILIVARRKYRAVFLKRAGDALSTRARCLSEASSCQERGVVRRERFSARVERSALSATGPRRERLGERAPSLGRPSPGDRREFRRPSHSSNRGARLPRDRNRGRHVAAHDAVHSAPFVRPKAPSASPYWPGSIERERSSAGIASSSARPRQACPRGTTGAPATDAFTKRPGASPRQTYRPRR